MAETRKLLQYDVLERLGEGARSTIYAVRDPLTGRKFAMKHVLRKDDKDVRFIEQMQAEYDVSKNFNHPVLRKSFELKINRPLMGFLGMGKPSEAFLLMELVEGKPVDQDMPRHLVDMVDLFIQVAEGLKHMHQMGYVHCDIKPINIMRTEAGQIKIIDFGQSCKSGTIKERIQGTPDYIAPEQVARRPVTPQTDVFNLGASLYWALTAKPIPTLYTINKKGSNSLLSHDLMETPQQLNPKVPTALSKLIMECIATTPSKRPEAMEDVIRRLELVKHVLLREQGLLSSASAEALSPEDTVAPGLGTPKLDEMPPGV
jgi:serine/threonine-protein kinase